MAIILLTDKEDVDGVGCAVLAKLAFGEENVDVVYTTQQDVNDAFIKFFGIQKKYDYDIEEEVYDIARNELLRDCDGVFISDLTVTGPLLQRIGMTGFINSKIKIFDHHEFAIESGANNYLFSSVKIKDDCGLCSGVSLFYEYLIKNRKIGRTKSLLEFVEMVRRYDTGEWKTIYDDHDAGNLAILFDAVGRDNFIKIMLEKLTKNPNESLALSQTEKEMVENYKKGCSIALPTEGEPSL